jgi:copper homeostasis protein
MKPPLLEICVEDVESALAACAGGADRIELCENLAVGGITPSSGAIAVACRRVSAPVHVLIRPRGGDFVYSDREYEAMTHDVLAAKAQGAAGVVLGALRTDGSIDRDRVARLAELARPLSITFHKAFDEARDLLEALDDLLALGVDRVLTSGGRGNAEDGLSELHALDQRSQGRIIVMPGGGITMPDVPTFVVAGFPELHIGSAAMTDGRTCAAKVRRLMDIVRGSTLT